MGCIWYVVACIGMTFICTQEKNHIFFHAQITFVQGRDRKKAKFWPYTIIIMPIHCRGVHGGRPTYCARTGRHTGSKTFVGLPVEQELYVCMRSQPHSDELPTFRGETEQRQHCENGGSICAGAECCCRHDMITMEGRSVRGLSAVVDTTWLQWRVDLCGGWVLL